MKKHLICLAIMALCTACSRTEPTAVTAESRRDDIPQGSGKLSFKVDGSTVSSDVWALRYIKDMPAAGRTTFSLTSNMHRDKRVVAVNFEEPAAGKKLEFVAGSRQNYGSFSPVYGEIGNNYQITAGHLTFSTFDPAKGIASGSFEFVGRNADGKEVKITEGQFSEGRLAEEKMPKL